MGLYDMEGSTPCLTAGKGHLHLIHVLVSVVLKRPSWKFPWLLSFPVVAIRSLYVQTWNLPEGWTAGVTLWLLLLSLCSPF